jgi:tryptophan synthase beta chain
MGIFTAFLPDRDVRLFGVEAGGSAHGHAATLSTGRAGVLHGAYSYLIQDDDGQVGEAHSIAAGLDYPGVGPEHSMLKDTGRVTYERASDADALAAFQVLARHEGILPALESSHALAFAERQFAREADANTLVIINLSGRGDKDMEAISEHVL